MSDRARITFLCSEEQDEFARGVHHLLSWTLCPHQQWFSAQRPSETAPSSVRAQLACAGPLPAHMSGLATMSMHGPAVATLSLGIHFKSRFQISLRSSCSSW